MKKLDISRPTIAELLDAFAADFLLHAKVGTRKRFLLVRGHLGRFLESHADDILRQSDLDLLTVERKLDASNAFARTMHADDLFYAMPRYLAGEHALPDKLDRRAQIDVVRHLCQWLWDNNHVNDRNADECAVIEVQIALNRAHDVLKAEVRAARS